MRVKNHPILGETEAMKTVTFYFNGVPVEGAEGEPIAAALFAAGHVVLHYSQKNDDPRSIFCAIGRCNECRMTVDGRVNVRTCVEPLRVGMVVETQHGHGKIE